MTDLTALYVRVRTDVTGALREIAEATGLSVAKVTEAVLAGRFGFDTVYGPAVVRAINDWKRRGNGAA